MGSVQGFGLSTAQSEGTHEWFQQDFHALCQGCRRFKNMPKVSVLIINANEAKATDVPEVLWTTLGNQPAK